MKQLLDANGFDVTFAPHDGGHGQEPAMLQALGAFLVAGEGSR